MSFSSPDSGLRPATLGPSGPGRLFGARACPWWVLVWLMLLTRLAAAAPAIPAPPDARVSDEPGVLSTPVRASLDRRLAHYEARSGHQIIVWIGETSGELTVEDFAVQAFARWKVGSAELDDGLAVFVFVEDRTVRVEVGYGLEPTITDLIASRVIRNVMLPPIERGEWDAAIVGGVEALVDAIEGQAGALPGDSGPGPDAPEGMSRTQVIVTVIGVVLFLVLLVTNPKLALLLLFFI
ncbi:TPM domain-containing protein, partial [Enhygromyxa salina]|uniref:TPM domain-containing protein n=1 Tax=Enhygromyxa salina TaxID=215803 RepID=UPI0011B217FF